jgi:predicted amidohydrolase
MRAGTPKPVTIGELVRWVLDEAPDSQLTPVPSWPPDVFAVAAIVLKRTGTYLSIGLQTPILGKKGKDEVQRIAKEWRKQLAGTSMTAPSEITQWWHTITEGSDWRADELLDAVRQVQESRHAEAVEIVRSLFRLFITADEVSHGAGFLTLDHASADVGAADSFELRAANNLFLRWWETYPSPLSSLCEQIHPTRAIVLPKIHVPQPGLTLNNLTRNLAFCDSGADIAPVWRWIVSPYHLTNKRPEINLLLIPYPFDVQASSFKPAKPGSAKASAGYFSSEPGKLTRGDHQRVLAAAELVAERYGRLDAVVLPEMATDDESFEQLCRNLMWWSSTDRASRGGVVVVGGVGRSSAEAADFGENKAAVSFDLAGFRVAPGNQQSKHHRWRLDRSQILQYGLGDQLDPRKVWWEHIALPRRAIYFWAAGWLTMSVLICEDLARQEPVAEIVRAVGANLVIALLADGPQLERRWSARYATVLADDPGCSVLTLTSLGMTKLTGEPPHPESRVIALWKDSSGACEIELPRGAFGVVLSITRESAPANTADGRTGEKRARLQLSHVRTITMDDVDHNTIGEPPSGTPYPMLQPYQATALTMALRSRIRSGKGTELLKDGWPEALTEFTEWLRYASPRPPEESQFWHALNDGEDLKNVIRCLYGDRVTPASKWDAQVDELRRLLPE